MNIKNNAKWGSIQGRSGEMPSRARNLCPLGLYRPSALTRSLQALASPPTPHTPTHGGPLARINPTAPQALTQAPPGPRSPPRPPSPRRAGVSSGRLAAGCPRSKGCPGGAAPSRRPRRGPCAAPRARCGSLRPGSARRTLGRAGNAGGEPWSRKPDGRWAGNHLLTGARRPGVEGWACWGRVSRRSPLFAYS